MNLNIINDYSSYYTPIEQPIEIVVEEDLSKKMIKLTGDSSTETTLGPAERDKEAVVNDLARSGTSGLG